MTEAGPTGVAAAEALHLPVGISLSAAALVFGTPYLAQIIYGAMPDPALDMAMVVSDGTASQAAAEDLTVLIFLAFPLPADDLAVIVF